MLSIFTQPKAISCKYEAPPENELGRTSSRDRAVILVVGAKEVEAGTVAMRRLDGKDQEIVALKEAAARLRDEAAGPLAGG